MVVVIHLLLFALSSAAAAAAVSRSSVSLHLPKAPRYRTQRLRWIHQTDAMYKDGQRERRELPYACEGTREEREGGREGDRGKERDG